MEYKYNSWSNVSGNIINGIGTTSVQLFLLVQRKVTFYVMSLHNSALHDHIGDLLKVARR